MNPDTSFAGLVKRRRLALGMSQAGLADLVGRSASAIRSWERGSSTPTDENVMRSLAAVLGIDESMLRSAVGLPSAAPVEEPDEVGGQGLAVFVEQGAETDDGSDESPAVDESDGEGTADHAIGEPFVPSLSGESDEEVQVADLWEAVAESVEPVSASAPKAEEEMVGGLIVDEDEGGHPVEEPLERPEAVSALEDDLAPETTEDRRDLDLISLPPGGGDQSPAPEPVTSAAAAVTSRTTTIPVGKPPAQPVARSYLDDPDQMMTYWIRTALTVAFTVFLLVVLFWALGRLGDSVGEVWDLFKASA